MNVDNFLKTVNTHSEPSEIDPIGRASPLPLDVIHIILQNLVPELPTVALVCRDWKALVDDKDFREKIRPAKAFGSREWKKYIGVDAGIELPLPRRAYGDLDNGDFLLTFIPKTILKPLKNDGFREVSLNSLQAILKLLPKKYLQTRKRNIGFNPNSDSRAFAEKRKMEQAHWVFLNKNIKGKSLDYTEQQKIAKEVNANISNLMDTAVSCFMEYIRSGERNCFSPPGKLNAVRIIDQLEGVRLFLTFTKYLFSNSALPINEYYIFVLGFVTSDSLGDKGRDDIGFLCAQRYF